MVALLEALNGRRRSKPTLEGSDPEMKTLDRFRRSIRRRRSELMLKSCVQNFVDTILDFVASYGATDNRPIFLFEEARMIHGRPPFCGLCSHRLPKAMISFLMLDKFGQICAFFVGKNHDVEIYDENQFKLAF